MTARSARALVEAGFSSLAGLEGVTRERLLAIPGIGHTTLAVLEECLGRPFAVAPKLSRPKALVPSYLPLPLRPEDLWRKRGLSVQTAISFAIAGVTLESLPAMFREDLLGMVGVSLATLEVCEALIGRAIPSRKKADPVAAYWRSQGFKPKVARGLSAAGLGSLEDLRKLSREDLLKVPGVGPGALLHLEGLLGAKVPRRAAYWLDRGLSPMVAHALVRHRIFTVGELTVLSREQFLSLPYVGLFALAQCEKRLGVRFSSPRHEWLRLGFPPALARKLALAGVADLAALRGAKEDALRAAGLGDAELNLCRLVGWDEAR